MKGWKRYWPADPVYVSIEGQMVLWPMTRAALDHFMWALFRVEDEND